MLQIKIMLVALSTIAMVGCSSLPTVVSSMENEVAIEFDPDDGVASTTELAERECVRYGRTPAFDKVDMTATPDSRIARYRCVKDDQD